MNGKGDAPRPYKGDLFRKNHDAINWHRQKRWTCARCHARQSFFSPRKVDGRNYCMWCWAYIKYGISPT